MIIPRGNSFASVSTRTLNLPLLSIGSFRELSSSNGSTSKLKKTYSFLNLSETSPSTSPAGYKSARTAEDAVNNILYNVSQQSEAVKRHTLSVFVDNETGVLSKVSGLLSARGFNIDSLSVSNTDVAELSRMTIVLKGPDEQIEQAKRQLQDLCDVWAVFDNKEESTLSRELCLVKVSCIPPTIEPSFTQAEEMNSEDSEIMTAHAQPQGELTYDEMMAVHFHRQALREIANLFEAKVVDIGSETLMMELVSGPRRVDGFLKMLRPYKIVEAARSGVIAMAKSKIVSPEDDAKDQAFQQGPVDLASLPPS